MATNVWLGRQSARSQVSSATVTAYDAATTYTVTIGVSAVSVAGSTDTAGTASALVTALQASVFPEFREVAWSLSGSSVIGTANTPGKPFTAVASVSGGTGTFGAFSDTTSNKSPNDAGDTNNWSDGLPTASDDLVFENSAVDCLWRVDTAIPTVDVGSITVRESYTGRIGLPIYDADGGYYQYRGKRFTVDDCPVLRVEVSQGAQAGQYVFAVGSTVACTATVTGTGGGQPGQETVWLCGGGHADNELNVRGGSVLVAPSATDAVTVKTLRLSEGAQVRCTAGVTLNGASSTIENDDSTLEVATTFLTLNQDGTATTTVKSAAAATTQNIDGGTVDWQSSGNIGTVKVGSGATMSFLNAPGIVATPTAVNLSEGATFDDDNGRITKPWTYELDRCQPEDVTVRTGPHVEVTINAHS